MKQAKEYLERHGIKPSQQRIAIMQYLLTHFTHPTADEIYQALVVDMPTLSRTTVYNTLSLLAEHDAVLTLNLNGVMANFDGDTSPHAHFLCSGCGSIYDLKIDDNLSYIDLNKPDNFRTDFVQLFYKGLCDKCLDIKKQ